MSIRDKYLKGVLNASGGVFHTIAEAKDMQFGMPLKHYALQYLYGSTGLRFGTVYSISGPPQSCKSPFVFDLMFNMCADEASGGPEGCGFLFEMESKLSPSLLTSMARWYNQQISTDSDEHPAPFQYMRDCTMEKTFKTMMAKVIDPLTDSKPDELVPVFVDWDSIGGAATDDAVTKIKEEGFTGKGFYSKSHIMKYFCENWSVLSSMLPVVFMAVNQEKADVQSMPGYSGPPKKHITGGESQIFKAGHIVSAAYRKLATGAGKVVMLKTTKTSFCDSRKIEVRFVWNQTGSLKDEDAQGHHWEWAEASAKLLADPEYVGELRDIVDVKLSAQGLVTCQQLGLRSVSCSDFESALFDPANSKILHDLQAYQKIDQIRDMSAFRAYLMQSKEVVVAAQKASKAANEKVRADMKAAEAAKEQERKARRESRIAKAESKKIAEATAPAPVPAADTKKPEAASNE